MESNFPRGTKDREFSKWSPNWDGPFKIHQMIEGNLYWLASLESELYRQYVLMHKEPITQM